MGSYELLNNGGEEGGGIWMFNSNSIDSLVSPVTVTDKLEFTDHWQVCH